MFDESFSSSPAHVQIFLVLRPRTCYSAPVGKKRFPIYNQALGMKTLYSTSSLYYNRLGMQKCGGTMMRRFLALALLAMGATLAHAQPSLPSSFQAKTIHS